MIRNFACSLLGWMALFVATTAWSTEQSHQHHDPMGEPDAPISATAVIEAIDNEARKVKVAHDPIPELGMPAMTMYFGLSERIDLHKIDVGDRVRLGLVIGADGIYQVGEIAPFGPASNE